MKHVLTTATLVLTMALGTAAAYAADNFNGDPVTTTSQSVRQITVNGQAQEAYVAQGEVLRFVLPDGKAFAWKFSGRGNYVDLAEIAPKGSQLGGNVRIYVEQLPD